jgi:hypothetical protein
MIITDGGLVIFVYTAQVNHRMIAMIVSVFGFGKEGHGTSYFYRLPNPEGMI